MFTRNLLKSITANTVISAIQSNNKTDKILQRWWHPMRHRIITHHHHESSSDWHFKIQLSNHSEQIHNQPCRQFLPNKDFIQRKDWKDSGLQWNVLAFRDIGDGARHALFEKSVFRLEDLMVVQVEGRVVRSVHRQPDTLSPVPPEMRSTWYWMDENKILQNESKNRWSSH